MDSHFKEANVENKIEHKSGRIEQSNTAKCSALKDFNSLAKERLNAIEISQRKWVEEIRNWSTTDEIQKAQLDWIREFSSVPSFNTINSPEKKKQSVWTLPFSPPKSSYDLSPRRGFCVYEPGNRENVPRKVLDNASESGKDVKVAVLEEPAQVRIATLEKTSTKTVFSPFATSNVDKVDKPERKRHITVRKKLHCLKKLEQTGVVKEQQPEAAKEQQQNIETTPKTKSAGGGSADRSEENRRSARKYIQRKRAERERQLRQQKQEEERAEQEQRARMERLKHTQHRILFNSNKKHAKSPQRREAWVDLGTTVTDEEKKLSSQETSADMVDRRQEMPAATELRTQVAPCTPLFSPRGSQHTPEKDLRSTSLSSAGMGLSWTRDDIAPPRQDVPVKEDIFPTGKEPLPASSLPLPDKSTSNDQVSPRRVDVIPLQKPETPMLSTTLSSKPPATDCAAPSSIESMGLSAKSLFEVADIERPVKLSNDQVKDEDLLQTFPTELQRKDRNVAGEKTSWLYNDLSAPPNDTEYKLLTAIANKRLLLRDSDRTRCEVGVQCSKESRDSSSTTLTIGSYSSASNVKRTQSEPLCKPNLILLPSRTSDPCVRSSSPTALVFMGTTMSDNLSQGPSELNSSWLVGANKPRKENLDEESEAEGKRVDVIKAAIDKYTAHLEEDIYKVNSDEDAEVVAKKGFFSDISFSTFRDASFARSDSSNIQGDTQQHSSFIGFAKFSLNMLIELLNEECLRSRQQTAQLKTRECAIVDKAKAEIAYLELEKKKFKMLGNEDGVRNVRKKIRGLIIKLQQNLEDIQLVKKMERTAYRGRRKLLLDKIDLLKDQLKKQVTSERKVRKDLSKDSSKESNREAMKEHSLSSVEALERRGFRAVGSEKQNRDFGQECGLSNTVEETQEWKGQWKQKLEDAQRRIRELEAVVKGSLLTGGEGKTVERGTSPLRSTCASDEDKKKEDCSYSDTFDQLSTSSQHDKIDERDARKMIALKVPLSPRVTLKRRYSSGSDESLLLSQAETQSDASDMETRVLALQQQLKQRKAELESLHREYKKSQRERLIAKEQSLLSQIQAYDVYIEQVRKELEKEKQGPKVKAVKPVIKHPKLYSDRRKSDTWIVLEKSLRSGSATNGSRIEQVTCDKLLDNKALEKFILKVDFPSVVSSKQAFDSPITPTSNTDTARTVQAEKDKNIEDDQYSVAPKAVHRPNDLSNSSSAVSDDEKSLLRSVKSGNIEYKEDLSSSVDEKIEFYEKLNSSTLSLESNVNFAKTQINNSLGSSKYVISDELSSKKVEDDQEVIWKDVEVNDHNVSLPLSKVDRITRNVEISPIIKPPEGISAITTSVCSFQKKEDPKTSLGSTSQKGENFISMKDQVVSDSCSRWLKTNIEDLFGSDMQTDPGSRSLKDSVEEMTPLLDQEKTGSSSRSPMINVEAIKSKCYTQRDLRSLTPNVEGVTITEDNSLADTNSKSLKDIIVNIIATKDQEKTDSRSSSQKDGIEEIITSKDQEKTDSCSRSRKDGIEEIFTSIDREKTYSGSRSLEDSIEEIVGTKGPDSGSRSSNAEDITSKSHSQTESSSKTNVEEIISTKDQEKPNSGSGSSKDSIEEVIETYGQEETASELTDLKDAIESTQTKEHSSFILTEIPENVSKESSLKEISSDISLVNTKQSLPVDIGELAEDAVKDVSELLTEGTENESNKSTSEQSIHYESSGITNVNKVTEATQNSESISETAVNEDLYSGSVSSASLDKDMIDKGTASESVKESILEEVISSEDSEGVLASGSSFPLPILPREQPSDQSLSERINTVEEITNVDSELDNLQSQSQTDKESSALVNKTDSVYSVPEEVLTDISQTGATEETRSGFEEANISVNVSTDAVQEEGEDSVDEDIDRLNKLSRTDEQYDSEDSLIDAKDVYDLLESDRTGGAPLIDALQREGDSTVDQIWRGIADAAVNDATDLVISTFVNKAHDGKATLPLGFNDDGVGESDDEEELRRQEEAEAEAEILRLQQLRIDKEIEELEEEEARRYYYIRAIPDKPPPPYTPRRSSLVASVVEAAGQIWDGRTEAPSSFMSGCHLRQFLWDLSTELVARVRPPSPPPVQPWIHKRRRRPKRHIRTKEELLEEVEKEAKIYLGVEERACRQNLIIRWSRKRRDHVDEILVRESQEEEWEWTDYSEEENIIKNRIAESLIQESIAAATSAIAQAFVKKFNN